MSIRLEPRAIATAIVVVVTLAGWSAGWGGGYHFDDETSAECDPAARSLGGWLDRLPRTLRPVTKLTYALEAVVGLGPGARRIVSTGIHATAAVGLLWLVAQLVLAGHRPTERERPSERRAWAIATGVALVWSVHPVHAESVLAIAGRSAVLANALLLWALSAHLRGRRKAGVTLFVLACLARETAWLGLLPIAVIGGAAADSPRDRLRRLLPYGVAALLLLALLAAVPRYRELADYSMLGRPWGRSVVRQIAAIPLGLSLYARPGALSIDHGEALPATAASALFVGGLALCAAAFAGVLLLRRRAPTAAVGLALWLAAILPTQTVIPKLDALTERPLTLALAGLLVAVAALASSVGRAAWALRAAGVVVVVVVVALLAATSARAALYWSDVRIWQDAARKSTHNVRPHLAYATALAASGRRQAARRALVAARRIDPINPRLAALSSRLAPDREEGSP